MGWIAILGALGLTMVGATLVMILRKPEDPLAKLKRSQTEAADAGKQQRLRQSDRNEKLQKFAKFLEPEDVEELSAKALLLRQAGYSSRDAVRFFHFAQMALGIAGLVIGTVYINFLGGGEGMTTNKMMLYTVGPGGIGYFLPRYWVTRRVAERKEEITRGFPDALDMMLTR